MWLKIFWPRVFLWHLFFTLWHLINHFSISYLRNTLSFCRWCLKYLLFDLTVKRKLGIYRYRQSNLLGVTRKNVYCGKCMVFFEDSEGKQFVVIQWFTRHEKNGFNKITNVPSFKLAPETNTKSYSTLPLAAIINGALMVPGRGRFWALLAPKEQRKYVAFFPNPNPN